MTLYEAANPIIEMDLDEVLGNFGLGSYQVTVCVLMGLVIMYSNISPLSYVLTAGDVNYRCLISECEPDPTYDYHPVWLETAIPKEPNSLSKCHRYLLKQKINDTNTCGIFGNATAQCSNWAIENNEKTIVNDFGMLCTDYRQNIAMVGTINSIGQFIGIPLSGFISDKYGRKFVMIIGSVLSAVLGTIRSVTNDYWSFVSFEFLDSMASCGVYGATFVLGLELVSPQSRAAVSTLISCFYPMGAVIMGFVAYLVLDWRTMLRIVYLPGLLILGYIWYMPESMRWLQTQNRLEEMTETLSKVAKSNGKALPSNVVEALRVSNQSNKNSSKMPDENKLSFKIVIKKIFGSREIFLRLINCSFCWITITLVYYGLSLTSVELNGNKFINFMLVNAVEIPAFLSSWYFMEHFSRRKTQALSFLLSGIGCITFNLVPEVFPMVRLSVFLFSKYTITVAFNTMYLFAAEMFPTEIRMTLVSIASSLGRFGSMMAPQMTLLGAYFGKYTPIVLFGVVSFIAGSLTFLFPETKDKKLPDTVKQAEVVGEV